MECLVSVGLWVVEPVAQSVWVRLVYLRDSNIDVETFVDLLLTFLRCEDDAHCQYVVDFVEGHMFILHLIPDGIWCFDAFFDFILDTHLLECLFDRSCKLVEEFSA